MNTRCAYKVGIDVGTNSVGLSAIEVDAKDMPIRILNSVVYIHDGGVDPENQKSAQTRKETSGVARRTRRLFRQRRKRLKLLDDLILSQGWPIIDLESSSDPYLPWRMRAKLVQTQLDGDELAEALSIAIRHIARHRGWRSPYQRVEALFVENKPSQQFVDFLKRIEDRFGITFPDSVTLAEVVVDLATQPTIRLRDGGSATYGSKSILNGQEVAGQYKSGLFGGKFMQPDFANEIWAISKKQNISEQITREIIKAVFYAKSPKGESAKLVGFDALPGQTEKPRAAKAQPIFQKFRIVQVVSNLRLFDSDTGERRPLSGDEKKAVIDYLMEAGVDDGVTWEDVANLLGIDRDQLAGTAKAEVEGERPLSLPPFNRTNCDIMKSRNKKLIAWWKNADDDEQSAMIVALSNSDSLDERPGAEAVREFLEGFDDTELLELDKISLPLGRAAYSEDSLKRLTKRMIEESIDLHEARKREFGIDDSWTPPADPIGQLLGNPGVDRVLKIVNRWLLSIEKRWGAPVSVNIEHMRNGMTSEKQVRAYEAQTRKARERNAAIVREAREQVGITSKMRREDITRYMAIRRQNAQCAYCGTPISYCTADMDHIVPRSGQGSTNTRSNLVAICRECNHQKGNMSFAEWAASTSREGVSLDAAIARVCHWIPDTGLTSKQAKNFASDVISRLKRTKKDDPIDNRSAESVAWMAVELHERVAAHFKYADTKVRVFRGLVTSEARKASGFEGKVQLIGGNGKTRLDRRHHAMDAAVIAVMRDYVAQVLMERLSIRDAERITGAHETWTSYRGADAEHRYRYGMWLNEMNRLVDLFNEALRTDKIPVMQNVRLGLGNSAAHKDTIYKLAKKRVGDAWSLEEIDSASTSQMYVGLTRLPDYNPKEGLPENPDRELRVKSTFFHADDRVDIFPEKKAAIAVRGGWAEIGNSIHHARFYRINGKKTSYGMLRVFAQDLIHKQSEDLFTTSIPPESISMRKADPKVRAAILNGTAEYITWLVVGSELSVDMSSPAFRKGAIGEFTKVFPMVTQWVVKGFGEPTKLSLKPSLISAEGMPKFEDLSNSHQIQMIAGKNGKGWRTSVGVLFSAPSLVRVERNALGEIRTSNFHGLPATTKLR